MGTETLGEITDELVGTVRLRRPRPPVLRSSYCGGWTQQRAELLQTTIIKGSRCAATTRRRTAQAHCPYHKLPCGPCKRSIARFLANPKAVPGKIPDRGRFAQHTQADQRRGFADFTTSDPHDRIF